MSALVIFACVQNAGRSQMAEAFFNEMTNPVRDEIKQRVWTFLAKHGWWKLSGMGFDAGKRP